MEKFAYILRICEVCFAGFLILISVCLIIVSAVNKELNKRNASKYILTALAGVLIFGSLFCFGEYSKLKLDDATVNRLMNLSIESIDMNKFDESDKAGGVVGYYYFRPADTDVSGIVKISKSDNESEDISYMESLRSSSTARKLFAKDYKTDGAYLLIEPRESDRNFSQFPLIKTYQHSIVLLKDGYLLEISYQDTKNNSDTVNEILENICR